MDRRDPTRFAEAKFRNALADAEIRIIKRLFETNGASGNRVPCLAGEDRRK